MSGAPEISRGFPKSARLKGRSDILRLFRDRDSRKINGRNLAAYIADSSVETTRFGISISRKVGGAVRRNRLKRIIREYLRNNKSLWPLKKDVLISLRSKIEDESDLITDIEEILRGLGE